LMALAKLVYRAPVAGADPAQHGEDWLSAVVGVKLRRPRGRRARQGPLAEDPGTCTPGGTPGPGRTVAAAAGQSAARVRLHDVGVEDVEHGLPAGGRHVLRDHGSKVDCLLRDARGPVG